MAAPTPTPTPTPAAPAAAPAPAPTAKGAPMTESRKKMIKYAIIGIVVIGFGIILYMTMSDDDKKKTDGTQSTDAKDTEAKKRKAAVELCKTHVGAEAACLKAGCKYTTANECIPGGKAEGFYKCENIKCDAGQYKNPYRVQTTKSNINDQKSECCISALLQPGCNTDKNTKLITETIYKNISNKLKELETNKKTKVRIRRPELARAMEANKQWKDITDKDNVKHIAQCKEGDLITQGKEDKTKGCIELYNGIVYEFANQDCPYKPLDTGCEFTPSFIEKQNIKDIKDKKIESDKKITVNCKYGDKRITYTCKNGKLDPDKKCPPETDKKGNTAGGGEGSENFNTRIKNCTPTKLQNIPKTDVGKFNWKKEVDLKFSNQSKNEKMSKILCDTNLPGVKGDFTKQNDITLEKFMEQYCPNNKWILTNTGDKDVKNFMCKQS